MSGEPAPKSTADGDKVVKTDDEWRRQLTETQYYVARGGATEPAFSGRYYNSKRPGTYRCVCCAAPLFSSGDKFNSRSGWPSYTKPVEAGAIAEHEDESLGMVRTEVKCANCDAHLGHVFPDGPQPTGLRYCINSVCLVLDPEKK